MARRYTAEILARIACHLAQMFAADTEGDNQVADPDERQTADAADVKHIPGWLHRFRSFGIIISMPAEMFLLMYQDYQGIDLASPARHLGEHVGLAVDV